MSGGVRVGRIGPLVLALVCSPAGLAAQGCDDEAMDFACPESWGMKFYTSVSLFTGFGVPERAAPGSFTLALEGGSVPQLSDEERRIGFNGLKLEDTNKTRAFGRIRARVQLTERLSAEAGIVPPLELNGATPLLLNFALGASLLDGERGAVGVRAYGQLGGIDGDFTCDAETVAAGTDLTRNPFQCEEVSEDRIHQRYVGAELSGALDLGAVEPYATVSVNHLDLEFEVRARYSGTTDRRDLGTSGVAIAGAAGARVALHERLSLAGEVFYAPLDVQRRNATSPGNEGLLNVRALLSYRVR